MPIPATSPLRRWIGAALTLALLVVALAGAGEPRPADVIIRNAKVITVDGDATIAQGVAVRDDRIVAVGSNADVDVLAGPKTRTIDAGGKALLPGLYDS